MSNEENTQMDEAEVVNQIVEAMAFDGGASHQTVVVERGARVDLLHQFHTEGLVIRLTDGSEFQITVVQSRSAS